MKTFELKQACMIAGRSAIHPPDPEIDMPDVDMQPVGSRLSRSHNYDRDHRDQIILKYHRWQRQGHWMVVGSLTKGFGSLPWPN